MMRATIKKWLLSALACLSTFLFAFGASVLTRTAPDFVEVAAQETVEPTSDFYIRSAALRLPQGFEGPGIRFRTVVKDSVFESRFCDAETKLLNVITGTLILPAALLPKDGNGGYEELTIDTPSVMNISTTDFWASATYGSIDYKESCAYVYSIPEENFGTKLVVRSYVQFENGDVEYTAQLQYLDAGKTIPLSLSSVAVKASGQSGSAEDQTNLRDTYLTRTLTLYDESGKKVENGTKNIYYGENVVFPEGIDLPEKDGKKIVWKNKAGTAAFKFGKDGNTVLGNVNLYATYEDFTPDYSTQAVPTSVLAESPTFTMQETATTETHKWEFVQVAFDRRTDFKAKDYLAVQMKMITKQAGLTIGLLDGDRYSTANSSGKPVYFWKDNGDILDLTITDGAIRLFPDYGAGILLIPISSLSWQFNDVDDGDLLGVKHLFFTSTTQYDYGYAFQVGEVGVYRGGSPFNGYEYETAFTARNGAKPNAYYVDSLNANCFSMSYKTPQRTEGAYKNAAIWDATSLSKSSTDNWQRMYVDFDEDFDATDMRYIVAEYYVAKGMPGITFGLQSGSETRYSTANVGVQSRRVYGILDGETQLKVVGLIENGALTLDSSYLNQKITLVLPDYLFVHQYGENGSLSSIDSFVMTTNSFYNWNYKVILGEVGYVNNEGKYTALIEPTPQTNLNTSGTRCRVASDVQGELAKLEYVGDLQTMSPMDAIFVGDSYIDLWQKELNGALFNTMTASAGITASAFSMQNGRSSLQIDDWNTEAEVSAFSTRYSPAKMAFHIGLNDINDAGQTADATIEELKTMFGSYHDDMPNTQFYWIGFIPNGVESFAGNLATYRAVNEEMKAWSKTAGNEWFTYIDLWDTFCYEGCTGENETTIKPRASMFRYGTDPVSAPGDPLHPNIEYGYPLWAGMVLEEMGYVREKGSENSMGDTQTGNFYHSYGWDVSPEDGNQAVNTGVGEQAIYYNGLAPTEYIYFEADLRAASATQEDAWPKVGLLLKNDDIAIFAYFNLNVDYIGEVNMVYKTNYKTSNGTAIWPYDWQWAQSTGGVLLGNSYDITQGYKKMGVAKIGSVVYLLVDGEVKLSRDFASHGLTADSKLSVGVMGFNRRIEVKNASAISGANEVAHKLGKQIISTNSYAGLTVDYQNVTAVGGGLFMVDANQTVSFTCNYTGIDRLKRVVYADGSTTSVLAAVDGVYSFKAPSNDVSLTFEFDKRCEVDIAAVADKVSLNGSIFYQGDVVTITPNSAYAIGRLYANGVLLTPSDGVYQLTLTESVVITGDIFPVYDGVILDGLVDDDYGNEVEVASYSGGRGMTVHAVKKATSGVFIHVVTRANTLVDDAYELGGNGLNEYWHWNSNLEFYLGDNVQRYVNARGETRGITDYKWITRTPQETGDGMYEFTLEIFVAKELLEESWTDDGAIQFNYAWKTKGESAYVEGRSIHPHMEVNLDWWAGHYNGGAYYFYQDGTHPLQATLFIDNSGFAYPNVVTEQDPTIALDGVVHVGEYPKPKLITAGDSSMATIEVVGKAGVDGLYLGIMVTHGAWSTFNEKNSWHLNDNIEFRIGGIHGLNTALLFKNGQMVVPASITQAAYQDVDVGDNKMVTTIELFIAGEMPVGGYEVWVGANGLGFANGQEITWQGFFWETTCLKVTESGAQVAMDAGSGIALDGAFNEALWSSVGTTYEAVANGATVRMNGKIVEYEKQTNSGARYTVRGVLLGFTINHTVAVTTKCQGDGTGWWHYMGPEVRINSRMHKQTAASCMGELNCHAAYQTSGTEGAYTTTWEMFIPLADDGDVTLSVGGVYETGFAYLWTDAWTNASHIVTENGIVAAIDGACAVDGSINEIVWKNAGAEKTKQGAGSTVALKGIKTASGIFLGFTVTHTKAITAVVRPEGDGTEWWHYMGPEVYINGENVRYAATSFNGLTIKGNCSAAYKTVDNGNGTYTTTWEMFIPCDTTSDVSLTVGGNYDDGWAWLYERENTLTVTANGIL